MYDGAVVAAVSTLCWLAKALRESAPAHSYRVCGARFANPAQLPYV